MTINRYLFISTQNKMPPRTNTRKKAKKGGKYLTQGAYGCTFRPAVKCRGNAVREKNAISKIMFTKNAENEFKLVPILSSIDPDQRFMLYPYKMCEPQLNAINLNASYYHGECDGLLTKYDKKAIFIKDGGENLGSVFTRIDAGLLNKLHRSLFRALHNVFLGLEHLHANDFVHLDIKKGNVVCKIISGKELHWFGWLPGKPTYLMKLIDFGLSNKIDDAMANWHTTWDYHYWPFDTRFIAKDYMDGTIDLYNGEYGTYLKALQKTAKTHSKSHPYWLLQNTTETPTIADYKAIQDYLKALPPAGKKEARRDILRKTDVYSLGILLAECYVHCTRILKTGPNAYSNTFVPKLHTMVTVPLYDLVDKMTHYDFRKRLTAKDAQIEFAQLLQNIEGYFKQK